MITLDVPHETLEKVSRQFGKLMERAKATDFPAEAETCAALAQKLLWESNLEETQLLSLKELAKRAKRTFIKDGVKVGHSTRVYNDSFDSREWKEELLQVLAKNFFCKVHEGYSAVVTVVGEPKNIQIVKDLYNYLEKQIRASRRVAYNLAVKEGRIEFASRRRSKANSLSQFAIHSFKDSFAKGAVASLATRLDQQQKENIETTNEEKIHTNPALVNFGGALVAQIFTELDEAFYEFFPDLHPVAIKLAAYKREIEYQARMKVLQQEREEREERIAAGLEPAPEPIKPQKHYKQRGRRRMYRSTMNNTAYRQGKTAGESIQINPSLSKSQGALNK